MAAGRQAGRTRRPSGTSHLTRAYRTAHYRRGVKSSVRAFVWGFAGVLLAVVFSLGAFAIAEPDLDPSGRGLVPLELDRSPGDDTRPSRSPDDRHSTSASPSATPSGSGSDDDDGGQGSDPDDHGGGSDDGGSDDSGSGSSGDDGTDDHDGSEDHDDD